MQHVLLVHDDEKLRRLGDPAAALAAHRAALAHAGSAPERRFLQRRIDALAAACADRRRPGGAAHTR